MFRRAKMLCGAILLLMAGCASLDASKEASTEEDDILDVARLTTEEEGDWVHHGVITVTGINPRSDIVVLPPSNQHVVWKREVETSAATTRVTGQIQKKIDHPVRDDDDLWVETGEFWPIEGGQGVVSMCKPKWCESRRCVGSMQPRVDPERYECESGKMGEYCQERRDQ